ncbi:hypothetical protein HOD61_00490 [archaeon]|jgi:hypothetical protein|nr:hypothetical protein [archaeon]
MKSKKGISPLIGWILLIGFAVAMASFVGTWMIDQTRNIEFPGEGPDMYCDSIKLSAVHIERAADNSTVNFELKNTGNFKIDQFTVGRDTASMVDEWCLEQNINLMPGSVFNFNLSANEDFMSGAGYAVCGNYLGSANSKIVTKITFVPWIKIDEEFMHCSKQKLILMMEHTDLNN